jgi:hypothetical protein
MLLSPMLHHVVGHDSSMRMRALLLLWCFSGANTQAPYSPRLFAADAHFAEVLQFGLASKPCRAAIVNMSINCRSDFVERAGCCTAKCAKATSQACATLRPTHTAA